MADYEDRLAVAFAALDQAVQELRKVIEEIKKGDDDGEPEPPHQPGRPRQ